MGDVLNAEQRDAVSSCSKSGHNWDHSSGRCQCCGWPATSVATNLERYVAELLGELKIERARAEEERKRADSWRREFNMYRSAWVRELRGPYRQKSHDIDALVLTTRGIVNERNDLRKELSTLRTKDHAAETPSTPTQERSNANHR